MRPLRLMKRVVFALVLGCGSQAKQTEAPTPTEKPAPDASIDAAVAAPLTPPADRDVIGELEAAPPPTRTQTQAEIAAALTNEGIALMKQGSFEAARDKFREAVARMPEPGYFFNLCVALYQEGRFTEALTACDAVKDAPPALTTKTANMMQRILDAAGRQGVP
jgi:Flp pilus assembly protein TadD